MPARTPLDDLPLDVLLALQEAMTDPTTEGLERARLRAAGAGYWLQCDNPPEGGGPRRVRAIPAPEAPVDHGGEELDLGRDAPG